MLSEAVEHNGGRPKKHSHDGRVSKSKLSDAGITHNESHRWQRVASVPDEKFEQHLAETREAKREPHDRKRASPKRGNAGCDDGLQHPSFALPGQQERL